MKNPNNYNEERVFVQGLYSRVPNLRYGTLVTSPAKNIAYASNPGGEDWKVNSWTLCREEFQKQVGTDRKFLFSAPPKKHKAMAAFFYKLETDLKLPVKTLFGMTQHPNVMWISVSKWWAESSMRRSLFTALLRASVKYNRLSKNFREALYSEQYLDETQQAVERFLSGYTQYTGNIVGWYSQFNDGGGWVNGRPNDKQLRKLLVKPKKTA